MKKIVTVPDPVLRKEAMVVERIGKSTRELVDELWHALTHSQIEGVGIAAPQIGELQRVFILRDGKDKFQEFINPEIVWYSSNLTAGKTRKGDVFLEGCLSIPNIYGPVVRPDEIEIEYYDLKGKKHKKRFKEPFSRYSQHEYDHLNGVLFTDHILRQKGKLYEVDDKDELIEISLEMFG